MAFSLRGKARRRVAAAFQALGLAGGLFLSNGEEA